MHFEFLSQKIASIPSSPWVHHWTKRKLYSYGYKAWLLWNAENDQLLVWAWEWCLWVRWFTHLTSVSVLCFWWAFWLMFASDKMSFGQKRWKRTTLSIFIWTKHEYYSMLD